MKCSSLTGTMPAASKLLMMFQREKAADTGGDTGLVQVKNSRREFVGLFIHNFAIIVEEGPDCYTVESLGPGHRRDFRGEERQSCTPQETPQPVATSHLRFDPTLRKFHL